MSALGRAPNGQFPKGVSGNPGGRPRKLYGLEPVLDEHRSTESVREVLTKLREMALAGEPAAMRLYLDRILGPVRANDYEEEPLTAEEQRVIEEIENLPQVVEIMRLAGMRP
jgi:hypothetical protein